MRSQVAANRAALRLDRYQLMLSQQQLAENLVSAYKGGGASVLNAVFQTGSFDDLLTRLDYVQQLTGSNAAMVRAIEQHHRQVVTEQSSRCVEALEQRPADRGADLPPSVAGSTPSSASGAPCCTG